MMMMVQHCGCFAKIRSGCAQRYYNLVITITLVVLIAIVCMNGMKRLKHPTIIVITPTHKRHERMADMTRLSQTLQHVSNLHWIVVEDGNQTVDMVKRLLDRSRITHMYFYATTEPGFPKKGWTHRNLALKYVRRHYHEYSRPAVVYFADDDNSYDVRLFDEYIRNVKTIGIWAVGLVGSALVEAPHVVNGVITSWGAVYMPNREFAVDMAGFAINLKLILDSTASFHKRCGIPETCFLSQFNMSKRYAQPFGHDRYPKEVLVWHTKSHGSGSLGDTYGYEIE